MKPWAKWTAKTVALVTGFAAAGGGLPGMAFAGTGAPDTGNVSVLSGKQVNATVRVPVNLCGNAAPNLGVASAGCEGGAMVAGSVTHALGGYRERGSSTANASVGRGNVVKLPVDIAAPVDVCGHAAAALGDSSAGCADAATVGYRAEMASKLDQITSKAKEKVWSRISHPSKTQLGWLGALPGVATVPGLGDMASLSPLDGLTGNSALIPANALSAYQEKALPGPAGPAGGGMSSNSFATLAIGALLAGVAALRLANRRPRARRPRTGQVQA